MQKATGAGNNSTLQRVGMQGNRASFTYHSDGSAIFECLGSARYVMPSGLGAWRPGKTEALAGARGGREKGEGKRGEEGGGQQGQPPTEPSKEGRGTKPGRRTAGAKQMAEGATALSAQAGHMGGGRGRSP